jgi:cytochrome c oxidase accessory protein FixG
MVFDFAYFREQMCTVICPYARLQSVLVDAKSLVIGYDERRGEPRGKLLKVLPNEGAGKTRGDCIDCRACVSACPTGIDIRKGLQLECVACAQCIDACDQIMDRIERPRGLIRYGSTQSLRDGIAGKVLRPRVIVYPLILLLALGTFTVLLSTRPIARVTVLRAVGAPFTETAAGEVANQVRIKVRNQSGEPRAFQLAVESQPGVSLVAPQNPLPVAPGELVTTSVFVTAPRSLFHHGSAKVKLSIRDPDSGFEKQVEHRILGPEKAP